MHTTQQNLDIMGTTREMLPDLIFGDESRPASPTGRGVVEHIEDRELGRVSKSQRIQLSLEQDILRVHIGVDEANLGLVRGVLENSTDDLEHGSDSGPSSNHSELTRQVWGIDEFTLGPSDLDLVPNLEEGYIARDVTFLIGLTVV